MGFLAELRKRFMRSLRTQTSVGGEWLGEQLGLLFPPGLPDPPEGDQRFAPLAALDEWALELAPEKYLGRLVPMVEGWARKATKEEVANAARRIGDDPWLMDAARQVRQSDPANWWLGVGLMMLQGAFKKAGLIPKARCYDDFKFEVIVDWN